MKALRTYLVDLKQIDSQIFLQENGFNWEHKELQLGKCLMANRTQVWKKIEECSSMDLAGAVVHEESIGGN